MEHHARFLTLCLQPAVLSVAFRLLPVGVYGILSRRHDEQKRLAAATLLCVIVCVSCSVFDFGTATALGAAWTYLLGAALLTHWLTATFEAEKCDAAALLMASVFVNVVAPCILLPSAIAALIVSIGFDKMFAAFSYVKEHRRRDGSRLEDCLFFLLIDPTLIYERRASAPQPVLVWRRHALHTSVGVFMVIGQSCIALVLPQLGFGLQSDAPKSGALSWAWHFTAIWLIALAQYIGAAGMATIQINVLALFGFHIPERFNYPLMARSPADFWRRWNMYLGHWLQRYVFNVFALNLRRSLSPQFKHIGSAAAVIATFFLCGVLHDVVVYAEYGTCAAAVTAAFTIAAVSLVTCEVVERELRGRRNGGFSGSVEQHLLQALFGFATLGTLLVFDWLTIPALAGFGLPRVLAHWVTP